jgi:hypothetical protein
MMMGETGPITKHDRGCFRCSTVAKVLFVLVLLQFGLIAS